MRSVTHQSLPICRISQFHSTTTFGLLRLFSAVLSYTAIAIPPGQETPSPHSSHEIQGSDLVSGRSIRCRHLGL